MCTCSWSWWILRVFINILIINQIRNNVWFSDVYQKTVSNNYWTLKFGKSTVSFTQVFDFVLPVEWVTLDVELSTLMVVTTSHHWIHRWLIFTCVWIVRIVHWDNEVIHLFLEHLLASCIFDIAACSPRTIVWFLLVLVTFGAIFNSEVSESVKFLSSWAIFVAD